ncbi:MAG: LysR family transcriptional regulator [Pseudomonadota bacterium]
MKIKKIDALWSHVHWLGVLASSGSFTAAAARLGVSKAAMSHRIGELEQSAGVPLVRRTTRSVRLTDAGQHLVAATDEAFAAIERSFTGVKDMASEPSGLIRITAPVALGRQRVVPHLASFLNAHPLIRLELDLSDRLSSLAREGFDLAIRHVETVPDTHVAWPLCDTQTVLTASPAYLRKAGTPDSPHDLAAHNCLHYLRDTDRPSWSFEARKGRRDRVSVSIRGSFAANNSETLRQLALDGAGIALLPDFSAVEPLQSGKLVRVLPRWRSVGAFGTRIYAIRPYSTQVPRAIHAFVNFLKVELKSGFELP